MTETEATKKRIFLKSRDIYIVYIWYTEIRDCSDAHRVRLGQQLTNIQLIVNQSLTIVPNRANEIQKKMT